MIVERVKAGLQRTTKRLGRPPMPSHRVEAIKRSYAKGMGIREIARTIGVSTTSVMKVAKALKDEARAT